MTRPIRTPLDSSSLDSIYYDPDDGLLQIVFRRTGHIYDYFGVPPSIHRALMEADSKGAFINQVIKPNFDYSRADFPF